MLPCYHTVQGYGANEIIIEKSRFIASITRAETEEEAQAFILSVKKKYKDATHNCSAYVIGENDHIQKANDDGEPSGTAGVPILEVLKKKKLKDTVVVVTRYFGGIKLGAGGLIRAYGKATSEGLKATGIVERQKMKVICASIDYTFLGKLENELRSSIYEVKEIHYLEKVEIDTYVNETHLEAYRNWIIDLTNGQALVKEKEEVYLEKLL